MNLARRFSRVVNQEYGRHRIYRHRSDEKRSNMMENFARRNASFDNDKQLVSETR